MQRTSFLLVLILLPTLVGCEEDVLAPSGLEESYSIYGILNPRLDVQTLLVSPVTDLLTPIDSVIGATVTTTNLQTGEVHVWKDSVVTGDFDGYEHIFRSDFRPEFGSDHLVEVVNEEGEATTVDVHIPERVSIESNDTGTQFLDVSVLGNDFRILGIKLVYEVAFFDARNGTIGPLSTYTLSRSDATVTDRGSWGLTFRVDLSADYDTLRSYYHIDFEGHPAFPGFMNIVCDGLGLYDLKVDLLIGGLDWNPPGGTFRPNVLAQPDALRNIENGFGFVAGGYNEEQSLYPTTRTLDNTWFFDFVKGRRPKVTGCGQSSFGRLQAET